MGYKPLADISLSELQSILANLTLITMDGEQVYTIAPDGFTFEDGVITLNDPPPEYALITAHMEDSLIHVDHAALKDYALVCTATPGATAISPAIFPLDGPDFEFFNLLMHFRLDAAPTTDKILYNRKTQSGNRLQVRIDGTSGEIICQLGSNAYYAPWAIGDFNYWKPEEWHTLGILLFYGDMEISFDLDGIRSEPATFAIAGLASGDESVEIGCAGVSVGRVAFINNQMGPLWESSHRPPASINYYNFSPVVGVTGVKDHSLIATYRVNLTLATGATIEAIELV